jgi:hypothetical protein
MTGQKIGMSAVAGHRITTGLFYIYCGGVVVVAILLVAQGISNGGLERDHNLYDWAVLALLYGGISLLWPVPALIIVLQLIGILPMPLTFGG